MKKTLLLFVTSLFMTAMTAQIATFPTTESFTGTFTEGTDVAFIPNWYGNTVSPATRIFRDVVDFNSAPAAMSIIPTSSFNGDARVNLNMTGQTGLTVAFKAKSMANGDGTRDAILNMETSIDGGTTWSGNQLIGAFPNVSQTAFASYSYAIPATANNQANVWVRFYVTRSTTGTSTAAKLVIDDVTVSTEASTEPQLTATPSALTFTQTVGTPSAAQTITISGSNLTNDVTITASAGFEVSLSQTTGFGSTVTFTPLAGSVPSTTVYVRMNATAGGASTGTLNIISAPLGSVINLDGTATVSSLFDPAPYALTTAAQQNIFTQWDAASAGGSFPSNMAFWTHAVTDPGLNVSFVENYTCLYNLTTRSRFNGEGDNGVSFVNTGNSQYTGVCDGSDPTQATGATVTNGRAGAVVLALNTSAVTSSADGAIVLNWTGRTILKNTRVYGLRMQYRIGNGAGNGNAGWTDFATPVEYLSGEDNTSQNFNTALPGTLNGQSLVEVRWVYYFISGTGSRAQLGLDDISATVTALGTPGFETKKAFSFYPNPVKGNTIYFNNAADITITDISGKIMLQGNSVSEMNVGSLASGIYFVRNNEGTVLKMIR